MSDFQNRKDLIMDPKLKNEKGDCYLHLENIFISKGYFLEVKS